MKLFSIKWYGALLKPEKPKSCFSEIKLSQFRKIKSIFSFGFKCISQVFVFFYQNVLPTMGTQRELSVNV
jgi:hypothetical protein